MEQIQFAGESLWIHHLGHFLILLSFSSLVLSIFANFKSTRLMVKEVNHSEWKKIGRYTFIIHGISILSVIGMIFYAMLNEMYEYYYVYQHVNSSLPREYIFSAFWEGQEGSFLLWMFWHVILGFILVKKSGKWESPVIMIIGIVQLLINLMLLGIYVEVGDVVEKIGSNPFVLLRDSIEAPIFQNADYLSLIDGQGLNPLLQNYWNVIHPPVLFLGFASVLIPFAFAGAGLITGMHKGWLEPCLKWALFSAGVFGIGILMGGAWAYEALSFGGYWAWDPVENSSFVPWLTLVAGIHTHLIAKNTGYSIKSTYFFYLVSFFLVVYSTFLTRSGILGDTSVHAFTEMGLETYLLIFLSSVFLIGFVPFVYRYKQIKEPIREESIYSREFWMFIGSLVLFFSAILIIGATSLPVFNEIIEIFNPEYRGVVIKDVVAHYNKYQIWVAIFVGLLSGATIFLRYRALPLKGEAGKKFLAAIGASTMAAILLTYLTSFWLDYFEWKNTLLTFVGYFVLVANAYYLLKNMKIEPRIAGSAMSHMGLGIMIIGIIASSLNKFHLTQSSLTAAEMAKNEELKDLTFLLQGHPRIVNGYEVLYDGDTLIDRSRYFSILFKQLDENGKIVDEFKVLPSALMDNEKRSVSSQIPDTKHYFDRDIFTHVRGIPVVKRDVEEARALEDSLNYFTYDVKIGESFETQSYKGKLEGLTFQPSNPSFNPENSDVAVGAILSFEDPDIDTIYKVEPVLSLDNSLIITIADVINPLELKVRISDTFMNEIVIPEKPLQFETVVLKRNQGVELYGHKISLQGFNNTPQNRLYVREDGDIVVAAELVIDGEINAQPIFLIRDDKPQHFNHFVPETGLHLRFVNINPTTEEFTFLIAKQYLSPDLVVPIDIAEDAGRNDWIYLEAEVFPGINFFWIGAVMMMLGFIWSMGVRLSQKRKISE